MVIFTESAMGIVCFFFEEFFWIEILKPKKYEHKTSFFISQKALYLCVFSQNSDFDAMV